MTIPTLETCGCYSPGFDKKQKVYNNEKLYRKIIIYYPWKNRFFSFFYFYTIYIYSLTLIKIVSPPSPKLGFH